MCVRVGGGGAVGSGVYVFIYFHFKCLQFQLIFTFILF